MVVFFVKRTRLEYTGILVDYFDNCDVDEMSLFEIIDMITKLGISYSLKIFWQVSNIPLEVKPLLTDSDILEMLRVLPSDHNIHIYLKCIERLNEHNKHWSEHNEPEIDEAEPVQQEITEPEINEPAEPEINEPEQVELEINEPGINEPEPAEPEINEPEIDEPEPAECSRAKCIALEKLHGNHTEQYTKLYDYLRIFGGHLLAAVGVDADDSIYPLAFAVVESENQSYWFWFLELLGNDLELNNSHILTFMTDRQKGLVEAVQNCSPIQK
ncbi:hypothetical protein F3Y22_tig00116962pilonHSYRG00536 [Hibiscus syriacus]|uniref:Uncharacterized protein n=1 Tax=Hibiscus syriacus TaxID=106335 RepID=A0A6A2WJG7_HIBSY|nr:hypothetical protein F3Y22_tig00116962pilonHSYRG00536 [Hibiscus syriacus]